MKSVHIRSAWILALSAAVLAPTGCKEDPLYTSENLENLDTDIELFQNGIEVPIGSSSKVRVDSLISFAELDSLAGDYLKVDADGNYYLQYAGSLSLDSLIENLGIDSLARIDAVKFTDTYLRETGEIDASSLSIAAKSFGKPVTLGDFSAVTDMQIDDIEGKITEVKAGFTGKSLSMAVTVDGVSNSTVLAQKSTVQNLGQAAAFQQIMGDFPITGLSDVEIDTIRQTVSGTALPSGVTAITDVTLKAGAGIKFDLSMSGSSVLKTGTVTPDIKADLSQVLSLAGHSDGILNLSSLVLNESNSFTASATYDITSLNLSTVTQDRDVVLSGTVSISNATTDAATATACSEDIVLNVSVSFVNLEVEDFVCQLEDVEFEKTVSATFDIPEFDVPGQVKRINSVSFSDNSIFEFTISPINLTRMPGLAINLDSLTVTFPEGFSISGDDAVGNQLIIKDIPLGGDIRRQVRIEKLSMPDPVGGKVTVDGDAEVYVRATASGSVKASEIPQNASDDIAVRADVGGNLKISDFSVTTAAIEQSLSVAAQRISIELPDEIGSSFGSFKVIPEGNPSLSIDMSVPDLGSFAFDTGDGIVITLPSMIEFGTVDSALNYNEEAHTITISDVKTQSYQLPIEALDIVPFKSNDTGKYMIEGEYGVSGTISAAETTLDKQGLLKLSGAEFSFNVGIPALTARSVSLEKLEFAIGEDYDIPLISAKDIPELLQGIGKVEMDDVGVDVSFSVDGLPDIGQGHYYVDFTATLPDYMDPNVVEIDEEIINGKPIVLKKTLEGFDFSSMDFVAMRQKGDSIRADINISGKISAVNPTVDINNLQAKVTATLEVAVSGKDDKIGIKSVEANIDYDIDTTVNVLFLGEIADVFDLEVKKFGLPVVNCSVDLESNIGVPLYLSATAVPFNRNGVYFDDNALSINRDGSFDIPYSLDPKVLDKTHNEISLDLERLTSTLADSLAISLKAGVEGGRKCYLEPDAEYRLHVGYDIEAPLKFGSGLEVSVDDISFDLDSTLMKYLQDNSFGLELTVDNHLPFGADVDVTFLDAEGRILPCNSDGSINTGIKPDCTSDLLIAFEPREDVDITKAVEVSVRFTLSAASRTLRPDDYIQIQKATIRIPEGISIPSSLFEKTATEIN